MVLTMLSEAFKSFARSLVCALVFIPLCILGAMGCALCQTLLCGVMMFIPCGQLTLLVDVLLSLDPLAVVLYPILETFLALFLSYLTKWGYTADTLLAAVKWSDVPNLALFISVLSNHPFKAGPRSTLPAFTSDATASDTTQSGKAPAIHGVQQAQASAAAPAVKLSAPGQAAPDTSTQPLASELHPDASPKRTHTLGLHKLACLFATCLAMAVAVDGPSQAPSSADEAMMERIHQALTADNTEQAAPATPTTPTTSTSTTTPAAKPSPPARTSPLQLSPASCALPTPVSGALASAATPSPRALAISDRGFPSPSPSPLSTRNLARVLFDDGPVPAPASPAQPLPAPACDADVQEQAADASAAPPPTCPSCLPPPPLLAMDLDPELSQPDRKAAARYALKDQVQEQVAQVMLDGSASNVLASGGMGLVRRLQPVRLQYGLGMWTGVLKTMKAIPATRPAPGFPNPALKLLEDEYTMQCLAQSVSPLVARAYAMFQNQYCFLVEYCAGGDLQVRLAKDYNLVKQGHNTSSGPYSGPLHVGRIATGEVLFCLLSALRDMHAAGIAHLDIKPANVFFGEAGVPLLGDFGLAQRMDAGDGSYTVCDCVFGTRGFIAPELEEQRADNETHDDPVQYTTQADLYAVGMTAAHCLAACVNELMPAQLPACALPAWLDRVVHGVRLQDAGMADLLQGLLQPDPAKRLSAAQALAHPYFAGCPLTVEDLAAEQTQRL